MKILLVDDEDQVVRGVSRIISCEEDEWEVDTASSGEAALEILEKEAFNVIVSDMRMPGMDGAQLLELIGQRYPSMLRVILSGQADRDTVLRAVKPMHQYLAKPCEPDKLFKVIKQAETLQDTIKSAEILEAIGKTNCLPSFPEVVNEINREIESKNGSSQSIAEIISKDPALSAKVLQLTNSAIVGLREPVADIGRAISLVGIDMIRTLAMSQAVYSENESTSRLLSAQSLFNHGFRVASICQQLAKYIGAPKDARNTAFAAGLLHDAGKLILLNAFPERYESILRSSNSSGAMLQHLELESFGATHQGIGGYLFSLWGLPIELIESVASHHNFARCARADGHPCQLVFAANWIAGNHDSVVLREWIKAEGESEESVAYGAALTEWQEHIANLDNKD